MFPLFEDRAEEFTLAITHALIFPDHLHQHLELFYIIEGHIQVRIDGCPYLLSPGNVALAFPGVLHGYAHPSANCTALMIICSPSLVPELQQALISSQPQNPILSLSALHPDVALCLSRLESCHCSLQKAWLNLLMSHIMPSLSLRKQPSPILGDLLSRAVRHVALHYTQPLTLVDVGQALGVSPHYLSHVFSSRLRKGFRGYLNELRVAQAQQLLATTAHSVTDICFHCGFESLRTFDRVFRASSGESPRQWRKQNQMM